MCGSAAYYTLPEEDAGRAPGGLGAQRAQGAGAGHRQAAAQVRLGVIMEHGYSDLFTIQLELYTFLV